MVCTDAPAISIWTHPGCCPFVPSWAVHTHTRVLGLLTRRANSTITVLPLKVFFVAHWAHAIGARIPVKSAASGTQHRHLATVRFLSHSPFFYKPEIDTHNPVFRGLRKPFFFFTADIWKSGISYSSAKRPSRKKCLVGNLVPFPKKVYKVCPMTQIQ